MSLINPIYYKKEGVNQINSFIKKYHPSKIVFLVDENTHQHCLPKVIPEIEANSEIEIIEIESGEINKNLNTCKNLWEALTDLKIDRKGLIINLGGGVLTDMGGFVAHCYKRGIKFINIPTTLLAMVDASIGGKTGVDLGSHKNQVGIFILPELVYIQPSFISTLSHEQKLSGFAEIIKHGLIADQEYWNKVSSYKEIPFNDFEEIEELIHTSIEIKKKVVSEDFSESGIRKILNFGHTIGHAVESFFLEKETPILHGEGVALGMIVESYISVKKGLLQESEYLKIKDYLNTIYPKISIYKEYLNDILTFMYNDKKNIDKEIKFVLLEKIGKAIYDISVEEDLIKEALLKYIN